MLKFKILILTIRNFLFSIFQFFIFEIIIRSKKIKNQKKDIFKIPIIIINYNQLFYLKKLISFLLIRGYNNIIIIDNHSDYLPLLNYYETLDKSRITVDYQMDNLGHLVLFKKKNLLDKYTNDGYYVLTDADIIPNHKLRNNFVLDLIKVMEKKHFNISKVGFALRIDNIPDFYPLKNKVLDWETKFWKKKLKSDKLMFRAAIDTTFALYKPFYKSYFYQNEFISAIRIAGDFECEHGGWYIDPDNMTDEQKHYFNSSNSSSSWVFDENKNLKNQTSNSQY